MNGITDGSTIALTILARIDAGIDPLHIWAELITNETPGLDEDAAFTALWMWLLDQEQEEAER
jgi:hypothetical protein